MRDETVIYRVAVLPFGLNEGIATGRTIVESREPRGEPAGETASRAQASQPGGRFNSIGWPVRMASRSWWAWSSSPDV